MGSCPNCSRGTIVTMPNEGDLACTSCGYVVSDHIVDESFPVMGSMIPTPVKENSKAKYGLSQTVISSKSKKTVDRKKNALMIYRIKKADVNRAVRPRDKTYRNAYEQIETVAEQMNLPGAVIDDIFEHYKQVFTKSKKVEVETKVERIDTETNSRKVDIETKIEDIGIEKNVSMEKKLSASTYVVLRSRGAVSSLREICKAYGTTDKNMLHILGKITGEDSPIKKYDISKKTDYPESMKKVDIVLSKYEPKIESLTRRKISRLAKDYLDAYHAADVSGVPLSNACAAIMIASNDRGYGLVQDKLSTAAGVTTHRITYGIRRIRDSLMKNMG